MAVSQRCSSHLGKLGLLVFRYFSGTFPVLFRYLSFRRSIAVAQLLRVLLVATITTVHPSHFWTAAKEDQGQ